MVKRILRTARLMRGRSTSCSPGTSSGKTLQPSSKPGKLSRSGMANVASGASMFPLRSTSTVSLPPDTADSQRLLEDSRVRLLDPHNPGGDHAVEVPHPAEVLEHLDEQDVPVRDYVGLEPHLPQPAQHGLRLWVGDQGGPALRHFY